MADVVVLFFPAAHPEMGEWLAGEGLAPLPRSSRLPTVEELRGAVGSLSPLEVSEYRDSDGTWRAAGDFSPARIAAEYEARRDALDRELRAWCRPVAAWTLRDGDPSVKGSHMGGRPALRPDERWPDTPPREGWVFLAVCDSNFDLGLSFSDAGFLGATLPAGELAAGDFGHLLCDGESS